MRDRYWTEVIVVCVLLFLAFVCLRMGATILMENYDEYCQWKYGENSIFDFATDYGYKINKCLVLADDGTMIEHYFIKNNINQMCKAPRFWSVTEWKGNCEFMEEK